MAALIENLRSGTWVSRERMRLVAGLILAFALIGMAFLVVTSDGRNDRFGRPLGTDFSNVYAAGTYVLDHEATAPFDPHRQYLREQAIFGKDTPFYGWHYPPFFLGLAALLALMPYALALLVWQGVTLVLYLLSIRAILASFLPYPLWGGSRAESARGGDPSTTTTPLPVPSAPTSPTRGEVKDDRLWLLLALAFPAVFINIGHGHNGFLTAALFAGGLLLIDRRPWIAGILFGLLAYKPQFGVLIPLVLAASGRWRVFASATITVAALALAVTFAFGVDVWSAFLASTKFTRTVVLEQGATGWQKIQSVFSVVRMWGGGIPLAYAAQIVTSLAVAISLVWLWRSRAAFSLKAAALLIGTILVTPYSLDYDLVLLAPAIAWCAMDGIERGFAPWQKTILALLW
ncbi:MAG TPA: glycosyltransferase family 87 protein, partial [Pseudolabrys sp.]|nr:glycosyltransferase family 87 protein [Pseudolabrys sp.]